MIINNNFYSQRLPTQNTNLTFYCHVCSLGRRPLAEKKYYSLLLFIIHPIIVTVKGRLPKMHTDNKMSGLHFGYASFGCKNYYLLLFIIHPIIFAAKGRQPEMQT